MISKEEYNKYVFWLNFDKQLVWIILIGILSLIFKDCLYVIFILIAYTIYGLKKQNEAIQFREEIKRKQMQTKETK